jgi:hypothetical protein
LFWVPVDKKGQIVDHTQFLRLHGFHGLEAGLSEDLWIVPPRVPIDFKFTMIGLRLEYLYIELILLIECGFENIKSSLDFSSSTFITLANLNHVFPD